MLTTAPTRSLPIRNNRSTIIGSNRRIDGDYNTIVGSNCIIVGHNNNITGSNNEINGNGNKIFGSNYKVWGNGNDITGSNQIVRGDRNKVVGSNCRIWGRNNTLEGTNNLRNGRNVPNNTRDTVVANNSSSNRNFSAVGSGNIVIYDGVFIPSDSEDDSDEDEEEEDTDSDDYIEEGDSHGYENPDPEPKPKRLKQQVKVPSESHEDKPATNLEKTCIICLVNEPVCAALPCGHLNFCVECSRRLARENEDSEEQTTCPTCRAKVEEFKYIHQ